MTDTFLVLGGGRWQLRIIEAARALGVRTVVADISGDAPGRQIADEFVRIDTNDREGLLTIARRVNARLVLAEQTDRLVPIAGFINEALGLPGITRAVAERFTNKLVMRRALEGKGVPMPRFRPVSSANEASEAAQTFGLPVIVKPLQAQSSMGVTLVERLDDVAEAFLGARAIGSQEQVLIEEFVNGTEVTVEGISLDGNCTILAMSEKAHYAHRPCVARLLAYPPRFAPEILHRLRDTAKLVVESLGLETGVSHAEYRVRDGVPHLVEVAARGGGNGIASIIVPHISGLDTYDLVIRRLRGERVALPAVQARAAILEFFNFAPGVVAAVEGVDACLAEGIGHRIEVPYQPGDIIRAATDDRNRPGYFIALGADRDDVDRRAEAIKRRVRVRYAAAPKP
ncbi:MAG TPA: ATP-grasp domain-containing protein [Polyangia bacterium]|nr:ATP-grasp domain-containing protein [Polyangia bacterium]